MKTSPLNLNLTHTLNPFGAGGIKIKSKIKTVRTRTTHEL